MKLRLLRNLRLNSFEFFFLPALRAGAHPSGEGAHPSGEVIFGRWPFGPTPFDGIEGVNPLEHPD